MKRLIAYLICLFVFVNALAQVNVTGKVIDRENSEPLIGASVIVKGADGKIKKFSSSKADGGFFHGLPGLILEAMSNEGRCCYVADGLENSGKVIKGVYGVCKYEKRDRKAILREKRTMIENPTGSLNAKGIKVEISPETLSKESKGRIL